MSGPGCGGRGSNCWKTRLPRVRRGTTTQLALPAIVELTAVRAPPVGCTAGIHASNASERGMQSACYLPPWGPLECQGGDT